LTNVIKGTVRSAFLASTAVLLVLYVIYRPTEDEEEISFSVTNKQQNTVNINKVNVIRH